MDSEIHALLELDLQDKVAHAAPQEVILRDKSFRTSAHDALPFTLVVYAPSDDPISWQVFCLSHGVRQTMLVRLFMFDELPDIFERVYPVEGQESDWSVQIWRIHYPPGVKTNPLYLERRNIYEGWPDTLQKTPESRRRAEPVPTPR